MPNNSLSSSHAPLVRRLRKPAAITSAGSVATALWFDEIMAFGEEILALIFLALMAGVIYLLDILMFKSRMPRRQDMEEPNS